MFSSKEYSSMPHCPDGDSDAVPQGSVLGLELFNIFTNDTVGSKCTLGRLAEYTKLSSALDMHEGWDAVQGDMDWCDKWEHEKVLKFSKAKCKVLHLGQGNSLVSIQAEG